MWLVDCDLWPSTAKSGQEYITLFPAMCRDFRSIQIWFWMFLLSWDVINGRYLNKQNKKKSHWRLLRIDLIYSLIKFLVLILKDRDNTSICEINLNLISGAETEKDPTEFKAAMWLWHRTALYLSNRGPTARLLFTCCLGPTSGAADSCLLRYPFEGPLTAPALHRCCSKSKLR